MDMKQLEAFAAVVTFGSFQSAATHLDVSQPTISARIAALEAAVDGTLFHRGRQPIRPTEKAVQMLPYVEQILDLAGHLRAQSGPKRRQSRMSFRIGTNSSCAATVVPMLYQRLNADFPSIEVDFEVGSGYVLRDRLLNGDLDFCIMHPMAGMMSVRILPLLEVKTLWVARPGEFPNAELRLADLRTCPVVTFKKWAELYRGIETALRNLRAWPTNLIITDSSEAIVNALVSMRSVGTLIDIVARRQVAAGVLEVVSVPVPLTSHVLSLCYTSSSRLKNSSALIRIAHELSDHFRSEVNL